MKTAAHDHNRRAWDERARRRLRHTRTATDKDLAEPLRGVDPEGWLGGNIRGWQVLCLAAGGGLQGILYAAAGARVTVVDLSEEMLALDRQEAARRGFKLTLLHASMDDLSALGDGAFDLVIQPVSTCYVPDVAPVFCEVARVTKAGGLYISQHKQPVSLQADLAPTQRGYVLGEPYHRQGPLPPSPDGLMHREAGTLEYLHRWEQLLGGMCRAGFVIEDVSEPRLEDPKAGPGTAPHRYCYAPPYVKLKARRTPGPAAPGRPVLWTPQAGG
jgi:SAM-dependent methyltransferase